MRSPSCPSPCPRRSAARRPPAASSPRRLRCRRRRAGLDSRSLSSQVPTTGPKPPCGSAAAAAAAPPTPLLSAGAGVNVRCGQPEGGCRTVSHPPPSRLSAQISRAGIAARGSCPLPIGLEQPSAERGRPGRGWARGAAARHRPHPHPVRLLELGDSLSAARAPRARRRAAAPSPFRRTTAESLARLSLRRAAAVALLLVWSTPSRGRRSGELVDARDARAASR